MKKINKFRFVLLALFLIMLNCRQEMDFENAEQQKREEQFFKADFQKLNPIQKKVLSYLRKENEGNHFVGFLKDQKGLPVWETTKFLKDLSEKKPQENSLQKTAELSNGNLLYSVPLTNNGEITSVLYSEIKGEEIINIREITNTDLWKIINNTDLVTSYREFILLNCLSYDKELFGNHTFINIPTDLLGIKENSNHRIKIPDTDNNPNQLIKMVHHCMTWISNCTCPASWSQCDGCNNGGQCVPHFECWFSWEDDGNYPSGNGGHNGGGGASPSEEGIPPKDPCTMNLDQFYRIAPGCGGNENEPIIDPECEKLKNNIQKAKELIEQTDVKNKNDIMKANILTDTFEKAMYWGKDASGTVKTSNIVDGTGSNVTLSISSSQFTPEAYGHNHPGTEGYTNFSTKDINQFYDFHQSFNTINQNYANGSDGSLYVMTLEDQANFDTFVAQYPMSSLDANNDWKKGTDIRTDEDNILQYFKDQGKSDDEAMDLTLGYLIQRYNMGVMISKNGNDGKFHPIQVYAIPTLNPLTGMTIVTYEQMNPCNL